MNYNDLCSWNSNFCNEAKENYFRELEVFLLSEKKYNKLIFPPERDVFNVFKYTSMRDIKVVILGQDPYHNFGQANGLAFSVNNGSAIPASLRNIYKEIEKDLGFCQYCNGDLRPWALQGVFLLNRTLTVEAHKPGSHFGRGWESFSDKIISSISEELSNVVFMLWGKHARVQSRLINKEKHLVLEAPHPSPLSAYRGFFGCKHFSLSNSYLLKNGKEEIIW